MISWCSGGGRVKLRNCVFQGFCFSFLTQLDRKSHPSVERLIAENILGKKSVKALVKQPIAMPSDGAQYLQFEGYWIRQGTQEPVTSEKYVLTPSVRLNLRDLVRVVATGWVFWKSAKKAWIEGLVKKFMIYRSFQFPFFIQSWTLYTVQYHWYNHFLKAVKWKLRGRNVHLIKMNRTTDFGSQIDFSAFFSAPKQRESNICIISLFSPSIHNTWLAINSSDFISLQPTAGTYPRRDVCG